MPIQATTLDEYSEKQVIVVEHNQTLEYAITSLRLRNHNEDQAYLIVHMGEQKYRVIAFCELMSTIVTPLGYDSLTAPVYTLPIAQADLVVSSNIAQSGLEVIDWVAARPESKVVM